MKNYHYSPVISGKLKYQDSFLGSILEEILEMVNGQIFPCSGAKASFRNHSVGLIVLEGKMLDHGSARYAWEGLKKWLIEDSNSVIYHDRRIMSTSELSFRSAILAFPNESFAIETEAETALWEFLKNIHRVDKELFAWDSAVENFVYSPNFGFSICGISHFVPLLHPQASSLVRRSKKGVYVIFNPHWMFRDLRDCGIFESFKEGIRKKELQSQRGWINPKLADHGSAPESVQYALTLNPIFDLGNCSFTNKPRPHEFPKWDMSNYPSQ